MHNDLNGLIIYFCQRNNEKIIMEAYFTDCSDLQSLYRKTRDTHM